MKLKEKKLLLKGEALPIMEEFYTIQGEGFHTGKSAYFIRVGGCDVGCHWCDVKESWNPDLHPVKLVDKVIQNATKFPAKAVVITGGEPSLYNLEYLTSNLKKQNIKTFLETSGAHSITGNWDWICLSPKKNKKTVEINYEKAHELKVIIHNLHDFKWAEEHAARVRGDCKLYLQPEWSKSNEIMPKIVDYVMGNPKWNISLQTHKFMKIP